MREVRKDQMPCELTSGQGGWVNQEIHDHGWSVKRVPSCSVDKSSVDQTQDEGKRSRYTPQVQKLRGSTKTSATYLCVLLIH